MKKIIIIILSIITLTLVICLILNSCNNKKKDLALSINKANNYCIGNNERRINQVLYFTRDNIFNTANIVSSINVIGSDEQVLNLKLNNIEKKGYTHKYENNKYYSYIYDLTIPKIEGTLLYENAKLEIISDDKTLTIPIGTFELRYDSTYDDSKIITVNKLVGSCAYNPYQTLSSIDITLENKEFSNITINKINMGKYIDLTLDEVKEEIIFNSTNTNIDDTIIGYMESEYKFSLSYKKKLMLIESFIEIEYSDSLGAHKELIDTYHYYDNGYSLPVDNDLINTIVFTV